MTNECMGCNKVHEDLNSGEKCDKCKLDELRKWSKDAKDFINQSSYLPLQLKGAGSLIHRYEELTKGE